ncbi:epididymal protein 13 [Papio anubis]|uniref:epididymal protein 13 n=1 Tax=Papio anubis TaxID=9555 RepID=UPI0012ADEC94|nr:epididymal protein 13 [Papio anubis]
MHRSEPFLKMSLLILLFLGLAEACTPREEETSDCKDEATASVDCESSLPLPGNYQVKSWVIGLRAGKPREGKPENSGKPPSDPDGGDERFKLGEKSGQDRVRFGDVLDVRCESQKAFLTAWDMVVTKKREAGSDVKPFSGTTPSRKPLPKRKNTWNFLKCAYMVITYLFVSYNKGDWCYCHYCNSELDIRDDPCCSF